MPRPRSTHAVLCGLLAALPFAARAADLHVAPGGADEAAGTEEAPLATVAHALSRATAGDRVLLRRGGTYRVSDLDAGAGRMIAAYGAGTDPVLTASAPVTFTGAWSGNAAVRTARVASRVLAAYVNGRFVPLARWPDTGFVRVDNDESPDLIVDAELAARPGVAAGRWTGAQVRWRRWSWWWETRPITAHSPSNTLRLGAEGRFPDAFSDPGSGYFIDGDLDELDAPGEWFWASGTLYLYPPSWADPATMVVEVVTTSETGVRTAGTGFSGIAFARFAGTALELQRPATIEGCTFEQLETDAIRYSWDAQPFAIRTSVFRDVRNVAVSGWANAAGPAGSVIERNVFQRIGTEPGYGGSGSWHAAGVIVGNGNAIAVRNNRFVDVGYAGIILGSDGHTVEHNVLVRTMSTLNDGAAIYTNCNRSTIRENIILDTVGNLETSHPWWPLGHGIWPEFLSDFRDTVITGNVVYGSNGQGLMLPNNFHCTVRDNLFVDNRVAGLGLSGNEGDDQDHTISGNTLAAVVPSRRLVRPENLNQWWLPPYTPPTPAALQYEARGGLDYGVMTGTTFVAPASGAAVIRPDEGADLDTLAAWTAAAPTWASAAGSRLVRGNAILLFNDTEASADMTVPAGAWTRADGTSVGATVTVAPFHGVVLVTTGVAPAGPPYHAASGIDWRAPDPALGLPPPIPGDTGGSDPATPGTPGAPGTPGGSAGLSGSCSAGDAGSCLGMLGLLLAAARRRRTCTTGST